MDLDYIINHLGETRSDYFNAVSPPIIQSSNFAFETLNDFREAIANESKATIYTRGNNPTVRILCRKLAALESAENALVFASGSAAIGMAVISQVQSGDHIVCVQKPYSWTTKLLQNFLARFGVSHTFVDGRNLAEIEAAIQPNTRLLYLESPNSLTFELQDLEACVSLAKKHQLLTCIDNSYASPLYQKPIEYGVDIVIHSGTKYLNGHSDVVFGVICSSNAIIEKIFHGEYMTLGGIMSPHDAGLVLRGLRTLPLRLERSSSSAEKIATFLSTHPQVESIVYPGHPSFPQYELAQKQMARSGGLLSFYLRADTIEVSEHFFHQLERFLLAVSWGGHESLVLPTAAFHRIPGQADSPLPWNLFRLYIGLEDPDWLIADLERAFQSCLNLEIRQKTIPDRKS
ncbi:MAG: PLP-dependent transferase [Saprospiraceae bacterium]|nr:PLP-dependent transferase [Saprospiraceae bacterium]